MTPDSPVQRVDVAVLGAGPAGSGAAIAAAAAGLSVLLIDEAPAAGGQIYRRTPDTLAPARPDAGRTDPDARAGDGLRRELDGSGVRTAFGWRVWSAIPDERGFRLDAVGADAPHAVEAKALLIATGAIERVLPFPGWTTPGVFGLAAATTMLKSQRISPGKHVVVAGAGPLLAAVAAGVLKAGAEVAAVVDLNRPAHWLAAAPGLALRPRLAAQGAGWVLRLLQARVPSASVQRSRARSATRDWRPSRSPPSTQSSGADRTRRRSESKRTRSASATASRPRRSSPG